MIFRNSKRNIERKHFTPTTAVGEFVIRRIVRSYPNWVTPDLLTYSALFIGILLLPVYYLINFNLSYIWIANVLLILHWISDATDGSLAIYRKKPRPIYGHYIDHTFDVMSVLTIFLGLGLSPILSIEVAIALLIIFYLWNLHAAFLSLHEGVMRISFHGFGSTEGRILVIIMQTYWLIFPTSKYLNIHIVEWFSWGFVVIASILFIIQVAKTIGGLKTIDENAWTKNK